MDSIRSSSLSRRFASEGVDALLVTKMANIRYLCGFTGSTGILLVSPTESVLFTDGRYEVQARKEVSGARVQIHSSLADLHPHLSAAAKELGVGTCGFEAGHVTVWARSAHSIEPPVGLDFIEAAMEGVQLVPTKGWVEELRRIKDEREIELIQTAAKIADDAFAYILERIEAGRTEAELAMEIEGFMRSAGAEGTSFASIVASGAHSALPHARASAEQVQKGQLLLFDFGCVYQGYCSDLTRTVVVGPAQDKHREVYEVVLAAQQAGLDAVRPSAVGSDVDRAARAVIERAGWGEAFSHGLGHAVGMEVHEEAPRLSVTSDDILEAGNVVTVEPGIYLEGWGGVRIEDLVLVGPSGPVVLSKANKQLQVI